MSGKLQGLRHIHLGWNILSNKFSLRKFHIHLHTSSCGVTIVMGTCYLFSPLSTIMGPSSYCRWVMNNSTSSSFSRYFLYKASLPPQFVCSFFSSNQTFNNLKHKLFLRPSSNTNAYLLSSCNNLPLCGLLLKIKLLLSSITSTLHHEVHLSDFGLRRLSHAGS